MMHRKSTGGKSWKPGLYPSYTTTVMPGEYKESHDFSRGSMSRHWMLQKSKFSNNILNTNIVKPLMNFQKNKKVCDYLKGPSQAEVVLFYAYLQRKLPHFSFCLELSQFSRQFFLIFSASSEKYLFHIVAVWNQRCYCKVALHRRCIVHAHST